MENVEKATLTLVKDENAPTEKVNAPLSKAEQKRLKKAAGEILELQKKQRRV